MSNKDSKSYKYIFGPVSSRRLGTSLGVDLMPHKTCSLDCVYCECGKTTVLTTERGEYVPTGQVKEELEVYLSEGPDLDYVTFSGSGEPTLHSGIGEIIEFIKTRYPQYKVALLTNSTLFSDQGLRTEVKNADLIVASLDAATKENFMKINKPHGDLSVEGMISGMVELREIFSGNLWLEFFIVPGVNDTDDELALMKDAVARIQPDKIQLNTLDRPGTQQWVKTADKAYLEKISEIINGAETVKPAHARCSQRSVEQDFTDALISTIKRRPSTVRDISKNLGINMSKVQRELDSLVEKGVVCAQEMPRGRFYSLIN